MQSGDGATWQRGGDNISDRRRAGGRGRGQGGGRARGGRLLVKEYEAEGEAELKVGHRRKEDDDDWGSCSPANASRVPIYVNA
jgi:hypothetical protein